MGNRPIMESVPFSEIENVHKKLDLLLDHFGIDREEFEVDDRLYIVTDQYGSSYCSGSHYRCILYYKKYKKELETFKLRMMLLDDYEKQVIWEKRVPRNKKSDSQK